MMRKILVLLWLLALTVCADDLRGKPDKTAPAGWLRYSFGSGPGLSIIMPGRPKAQRLGSPPGIKQTDMYLSTGHQTVALVEVLEFSLSSDDPTFRGSFFPAAFSEFKSSYEKSSHTSLKILGRKPAQLGSFKGFEESYRGPGNLGKLRILMRGKRGFFVGAFVPQSSAGLLDQLLRSARLTD